MKRTYLLYALLLVAVGTAILGVLHLGASLPAPQVAPGVVAGSVAATTEPASALASLASGLKSNLEQPLGHLFLQLLVILIASRLVSRLFVRMGQPAVVGEMAAGILLGPSLFGLLAPGAFGFVFPADSMGVLRILSQIGVCLFMFSVGMEVNVKQLRGKAQAAVAVSHASIVIPYLLGVLLAWFLFSSLAAPGGNFTAFALFMGISMSITAFPVLARILQDRGLSQTALGTTAITCAAVDDVTAWSILAFVVAVVTASSVGGAALSLVLVLGFVAVMLAGVRRGLSSLIGERQLAERDPSRATLALVACVVMAAAFSTELLGIHSLFGAFLAGMIMPEAHDFRRKIGTRLESFSSVLLLPLFFTFTGLRTQVGLIDDLQGWLLCLLIIAVATVGKLGASAIAARLTGMAWRESLQLGALMNTRGLMELIALNMGYDLGILPSRIFTMLVIMALVTTMLTGPLLTLFAGRQAPVHGLQRPSSP
jgi:Kef-type K+ transport system membrane component KefB